MKATDLLQLQHDQTEALIDAVVAARPSERRELFLQLARSLTLHARLEEELFYPGVNTAETADLVGEAHQEHARVKGLIGQIAQADPASREYDALLVSLKAWVLGHVAEEQNELFPKVEALLGAERLLELGAMLETRWQELAKPGELPQYAHADGA